MVRLDLDVPLLEQRLPVLEVVAGALRTGARGRRSVPAATGIGRHVEVAQMDAELDAVGAGDHQVPRVVLAEAFDGELAADCLERLEDGGPVLAVAEPELGSPPPATVVLEDQVVRVELLQPSAPSGAGRSEGSGKRLALGSWRKSFIKTGRGGRCEAWMQGAYISDEIWVRPRTRPRAAERSLAARG